MKQKVKAETEASLDKTTNTTANTKSSSNLPHSHSITSSIKSPPEPSSTVPTNSRKKEQISSTGESTLEHLQFCRVKR
jgi:hypothetical protein